MRLPLTIETNFSLKIPGRVDQTKVHESRQRADFCPDLVGTSPRSAFQLDPLRRLRRYQELPRRSAEVLARLPATGIDCFHVRESDNAQIRLALLFLPDF